MKFAAVFTVSLAYAAFRYLVFGPVAIANLPCFVMNKALALSSVLALCVAAFHARAQRDEDQRRWFSFFKATLLFHVMLSVFLLSPDYYPKMYAEGKLNLYGELFMLFGVLALFLLLFRTIARDLPVKMEILQPLSIVAIALHNLFLGVRGWPKWNTEWPGYMPPITMLSFIAALIALFFTAAPRSKLLS